jgi:hypothetical protein
MLLQQLLGLIWIIREFKVRPAQINPMESLLNFFLEPVDALSLMATPSDQFEITSIVSEPLA